MNKQLTYFLFLIILGCSNHEGLSGKHLDRIKNISGVDISSDYVVVRAEEKWTMSGDGYTVGIYASQKKILVDVRGACGRYKMDEGYFDSMKIKFTIFSDDIGRQEPLCFKVNEGGDEVLIFQNGKAYYYKSST